MPIKHLKQAEVAQRWSVSPRTLERWRWISYIGLAIVVYVALSMIWHGSHDVIAAFT